jgi:uncharacterized membrane protein YoaK (UPF0700 family)
MRSRGEIYIAGFLTWIAGYVDAVGFVALLHIYTANMSGNSVALGIQLWDRNWKEAFLRAWPVANYVAGLLIGRILLAIGGRLGIKRVAAGAFCIEIAVLLPVAFAQPVKSSQGVPVQDVLFIAVLALAMGLQNATLTHFSSLTLHTGFVTGTLVKMVEQFTKWLIWSYDALTKRHATIAALIRESQDQKDFQTAVLLAAVWSAYVAGAICGAAGQSAFDLRCLFVPIAGLALLALVGLRTPLALKDKQEQVTLP